ncbi:MAG TPA: TraB/GumN family protein [Chitinophagaceae bacterium]|jgi:Uncharacterized protein conserved in bacteria
MKKVSLGLLLTIIAAAVLAQQKNITTTNENTLLWKISGNGLAQPSYLFGTIHMLCADEALLSDSLKKIIGRSEQVYMEVDMDNLFEMLGMMKQMKMRNDTTWADLLSAEDYEKVKSYFEKQSSLMPFSMMETFKPFLAASLLMESGIQCSSAVAMEQVIMAEAKKNKKQIKGLETMASQMSIFDQIPYKLQAQQLVEYIDKSEAGKTEDTKEYDELINAYREQDLKKLEEITIRSDMGLASFTDILLYNRNHNWVEKLKTLLPEKSLLIAVGAGHLPGEKGVINLLRKAGYTLTPIRNKVTITKEI